MRTCFLLSHRTSDRMVRKVDFAKIRLWPKAVTREDYRITHASVLSTVVDLNETFKKASAKPFDPSQSFGLALD